MARTQQQIYNQLVPNYTSALQSVLGRVANPEIFLPSNWSMYNLEGLILWIVAGGVAIFEQIFDNYTTVIEQQIAAAAPNNAMWIQNMCLNFFQYDATTPQIVQFDTTNGTFAPYYPVVDATKRIVTQCAIVPGTYGTTKVKVATGGITPVALTNGTGGQLTALQAFLNTITVPGITIVATSDDADEMYLAGTVTYNGQYSAIIQNTVIAAINSFLVSIPSTGIVSVGSSIGLLKVTDLIAAVRAVPGVIDFEPTSLSVRLHGTAINSGAILIQGDIDITGAATWLANEYNTGFTGAGYIISETTTGYTLANSLTYNPL